MYENIPQTLKDNEPFCLWRIDIDKKVPYQITGQRASTSDPATFVGFDDVMACFDDQYLGIGVLNTTFTKIDIDDCVEDGELSPFAEEVVDAVDSYTELSPSGTGIHIICYTPGICYDKSRYYMNKRSIGMEVYIPGETNRFFTVTGNMLRDRDIEERTSEVESILEKYMVRPDADRKAVNAPGSYLSDDTVLEKANASKQGGRSSMPCGAETGKACTAASPKPISLLQPCSHSGAAAIWNRWTDFFADPDYTALNGMNGMEP